MNILYSLNGKQYTHTTTTAELVQSIQQVKEHLNALMTEDLKQNKKSKSYFLLKMNQQVLFDSSQPFPNSLPPQSTQSQPTQQQSVPLQFYQPTANAYTQQSYAPPEVHSTKLDFLSAFGSGGLSGEPPLLTELGINFSHIKSKVCFF